MGRGTSKGEAKDQIMYCKNMYNVILLSSLSFNKSMAWVFWLNLRSILWVSCYFVRHSDCSHTVLYICFNKRQPFKYTHILMFLMSYRFLVGLFGSLWHQQTCIWTTLKGGWCLCRCSASYLHSSGCCSSSLVWTRIALCGQHW